MRMVKLALILALLFLHAISDAAACSGFVPFDLNDDRRTGRMADVAINIGLWDEDFQRNTVFSTTVRSGERTGIVGLYADNPSSPEKLMLRIANQTSCTSVSIRGPLIEKLWSVRSFRNFYEGEHGLNEADMPNKEMLLCIADSDHELSSVDLLQIDNKLVASVKTASGLGAVIYVEGQGCSSLDLLAWQPPDPELASLGFLTRSEVLGVGLSGFAWKQGGKYYFGTWDGTVKGPSSLAVTNGDLRAFIEQESGIDLSTTSGSDQFVAASVLSDPFRRTQADLFPSPLYYVFGG